METLRVVEFQISYQISILEGLMISSSNLMLKELMTAGVDCRLRNGWLSMSNESVLFQFPQ